MSNEEILSDINSGKKKLIGKWEYILNYWTPVVAMIGGLVVAIFWFANAEGRIFSDADTRIRTEKYMNRSEEDRSQEFITKQEFELELKKYYELAKENRSDIKEILKYLRK